MHITYRYRPSVCQNCKEHPYQVYQRTRCQIQIKSTCQVLGTCEVFGISFSLYTKTAFSKFIHDTARSYSYFASASEFIISFFSLSLSVESPIFIQHRFLFAISFRMRKIYLPLLYTCAKLISHSYLCIQHRASYDSI